MRVERESGEEAQVDFGCAGRMIDPQTGALRRTWAFVATLAWSRYQYVEVVFDQSVATWLPLHRHAFAYFGGAPSAWCWTTSRRVSRRLPGTTRRCKRPTANVPSTTAS